MIAFVGGVIGARCWPDEDAGGCPTLTAIREINETSIWDTRRRKCVTPPGVTAITTLLTQRFAFKCQTVWAIYLIQGQLVVRMERGETV